MYYILLLLIFFGCANTPNGAIDLSPEHGWVKEGYALNLSTGEHLYRDDFVELLIQTHGKRVAMYCIEHYRYETIQVMNKTDTIYYIVR